MLRRRSAEVLATRRLRAVRRRPMALTRSSAPRAPLADTPAASEAACELTILMPCLNEARTIGRCIDKAMQFLAKNQIAGEVLIADNGSTDGSFRVARDHGARVVFIEAKGYGAALLGGIRAARGRFVIMGDSDDSYDFARLEAFVARLREGFDLVMGNRFRGGILPGAMPFLHRYLGNPVLSMIGRLFSGSPCRDFHCGLRGFRRDAILALGLRAQGMEFATEMVVKAAQHRLRVTEVPTTLSPDGRGRPPHLRTWRDGWRHLRFMFLYSPFWLFLAPGAVLFTAGFTAMAALVGGPVALGTVTFDVNTLYYAGLAVSVGFQAMLFWAFAKMYGARTGITPRDARFEALIAHITLERALGVATVLLTAGIGLAIGAVHYWETQHFGPLPLASLLRVIIPSGALVSMGLQVIEGAFFMALLGIAELPKSTTVANDAAPALKTAS